VIVVLDEIFDSLQRQILEPPPENGGALLGPHGIPAVTQFLFDSDAQTSSSTYLPSEDLTRRVAHSEKEQNLEFKGVIHSHPGTLDRPSGPDREAVAKGLEINPQLGYFLLPIVNQIRVEGCLPEHVMPFHTGKITWHVGYPRRQGAPLITEINADVMPVQADMNALAKFLGVEYEQAGGSVELEGRMFIRRHLHFDEDSELIFLFGFDYPASPPIVLCSIQGEEVRQLNLDWPVTTAREKRMLTAMARHFDGGMGKRRNYTKAWGPTRDMLITRDNARGLRAGWTSAYTPLDAGEKSHDLALAMKLRTKGLVEEEASRKSITVFGLGSVGSYIAEQLVRNGVNSLTLIDNDTVDAPNLSRTCYSIRDVGLPKTDALARHLLNISPEAEIQTHSRLVQEFDADELSAIIEDSSLTVGATDDIDAQRLLNRFAYFHQRPAVYCALYQAASAGEIYLSVPGKSPCYLCATGFRKALVQGNPNLQRNTDYGTGRLEAEVALSANIHHVTSAAVSLILSILSPQNSKLHQLAEDALQSGKHYIIMGMEPDNRLFHSIFENTPGQHAYQSMWASVEKAENCPVCGDMKTRVNPLKMKLQSASAETLRRKSADVS